MGRGGMRSLKTRAKVLRHRQRNMKATAATPMTTALVKGHIPRESIVAEMAKIEMNDTVSQIIGKRPHNRVSWLPAITYSSGRRSLLLDAFLSASIRSRAPRN